MKGVQEMEQARAEQERLQERLRQLQLDNERRLVEDSAAFEKQREEEQQRFERRKRQMEEEEELAKAKAMHVQGKLEQSEQRRELAKQQLVEEKKLERELKKQKGLKVGVFGVCVYVCLCLCVWLL